MLLLITTSTLMLFLKHPLSMGFIILTHTIIMSMIMGLLSLNFWFSYILMLIMIGGLLVLFIYMTSVASNEKFKFNMILLLFFLFMISWFLMKIIFLNKYQLNFDMNNELLKNMYFNLNMNKFISFPNSNIFILIMFYLLVTMIAIVKITKVNFGPLRQMN
uniref:NADH-ubiquinone oxidoreductase chain 6 n=1 Tax=Aiolocaria hexaspilota TaxID=419962 RepID=A0A4P8GC66_9CUCU|nr:NADH dehydrogenase subunit 6 [Aiolocaria hexaspilota]QCO91582.1 NADH dehydrogenase subunit 6 [Aiolocaria hexaspilota]